MNRIVLIGDGLTDGGIGVSYYKFLRNKETIVNKGQLGETLLGASAKVSKMLQDSQYEDVNKYVLQIGLNDVLFPVLKLHSRLWNLLVGTKLFFGGDRLCYDAEMFKDHYEKLILKLRANEKEVVVIGLPYLENRILKINDTILEYNEVLKNLCHTYKVTFIDLSEIMKTATTKKGSYFYGKTALIPILDVLFTSILPFSNAVSKCRGLSVTVDGIHPNYRMAKRFAKIVEIKLSL